MSKRLCALSSHIFTRETVTTEGLYCRCTPTPPHPPPRVRRAHIHVSFPFSASTNVLPQVTTSTLHCLALFNSTPSTRKRSKKRVNLWHKRAFDADKGVTGKMETVQSQGGRPSDSLGGRHEASLGMVDVGDKDVGVVAQVGPEELHQDRAVDRLVVRDLGVNGGRGLQGLTLGKGFHATLALSLRHNLGRRLGPATLSVGTVWRAPKVGDKDAIVGTRRLAPDLCPDLAALPLLLIDWHASRLAPARGRVASVCHANCQGEKSNDHQASVDDPPQQTQTMTRTAALERGCKGKLVTRALALTVVAARVAADGFATGGSDARVGVVVETGRKVGLASSAIGIVADAVADVWNARACITVERE